MAKMDLRNTFCEARILEPAWHNYVKKAVLHRCLPFGLHSTRITDITFIGPVTY